MDGLEVLGVLVILVFLLIGLSVWIVCLLVVWCGVVKLDFGIGMCLMLGVCGLFCLMVLKVLVLLRFRLGLLCLNMVVVWLGMICVICFVLKFEILIWLWSMLILVLLVFIVMLNCVFFIMVVR